MKPPPAEPGLDLLAFYMRACQRGQRTLILCLVLLSVGLSGVLTVVLVQYNQQQDRYKVAKSERHEIERKVDSLSSLLRAAQEACR